MKQTKVRRVCEKCNGGWIKVIEEEAIAILKPAIVGGGEIYIHPEAQATVAAWIAIMAILLQYAYASSVVTKPIECAWLRLHKSPPGNWIISIGKIPEAHLENEFTVHTFSHEPAVSSLVTRKSFDIGDDTPDNSQVATFWIGKLMVQAFSSPSQFVYQNYDVFARASGLVRIWPIGRNWRFGRKVANLASARIIPVDEALALRETFFRTLRVT